MNQNLNSSVVSLNDVDIDNLNIYDPTASSIVTPQFAIEFDAADGEKTYFLCQGVSSQRVLIEISEESALLIQNTDEFPEDDEDGNTTPEQMVMSRALREYNLAAVRLGLMRPQLTYEQIENLPPSVLSDLSSAITRSDITDEEEDTDGES